MWIASNTESDPHWSSFGSGPETRTYPVHLVHWLHCIGFIPYPCDIISSLSGCMVPTAAAEEVLNRCTVKESETDEIDRFFSVAFNYEFIEDIQDKYVVLYLCLIHTAFRTNMLCFFVIHVTFRTSLLFSIHVTFRTSLLFSIHVTFRTSLLFSILLPDPCNIQDKLVNLDPCNIQDKLVILYTSS